MNSSRSFRVNPLSIESESLLLGYYTLANEWQDGILTTMLRKANRVGDLKSREREDMISIDQFRIVIQVGFVSMELLVELGQIYYHRY